jgi:hypothetical protein
MQAAHVRRDLEHQAQMATFAYWTATVINAGTMGRKDRIVQPKDLLPGEPVKESGPPKPPTAAQIRRARIKKAQTVLLMALETPGLFASSPQVVEDARAELAALGGKEPRLSKRRALASPAATAFLRSLATGGGGEAPDGTQPPV